MICHFQGYFLKLLRLQLYVLCCIYSLCLSFVSPSFSLSLSLSHQVLWGSQLPCHEDTQVVYRETHMDGEEPTLLAISHIREFRSGSSSPSQASDDCKPS